MLLIDVYPTEKSQDYSQDFFCITQKKGLIVPLIYIPFYAWMKSSRF